MKKKISGPSLVGGLFCVTITGVVHGATISAPQVNLESGSTGTLRIFGGVADEPTFGWTVLLQLVPRENAQGKIGFTPATSDNPPPHPTVRINHEAGRSTVRVIERENWSRDIKQINDVWPDRGTFTPFDTSETESSMLNGAVDDNGTFVNEPVTYAGILAEFPIRASEGASGDWDVLLITPFGDSGWEGIATELVHGVITVVPSQGIKADAGDAVRQTQQPISGQPKRREAASRRSSKRSSEK